MKKVLILISGGIDSPVAACKLIKAGYDISLIHFYNQTNTSQGVKEKIEKLAEVLKAHEVDLHQHSFGKAKTQKKIKLYIIPFQDVQMEIIKQVPAKYRMLVYRRFMYRIAEQIAKKNKIKFLATGDSLAQVASQTLDNMRAISMATKLEILRPLLGFDKQEIMTIAKEIGTYEISIMPYADCCSYMIADHPETRASPELVDKQEENLKIKKLVAQAIKKKEVA